MPGEDLNVAKCYLDASTLWEVPIKLEYQILKTFPETGILFATKEQSLKLEIQF